MNRLDRTIQRDEEPLRARPLSESIRIGRADSGDPDRAQRLEWWLANGRGGYAAGTVAGSLTRGYHGLLTATIDSPLGRRLQVAKLDATLIDGERHWPLFTNRWADGCVEPAGHVLIDSFRLDGRMPVWHWACGDLMIEQRIWMPPGEDSVWSVYRLLRSRPDAAPRVRIALLLADRDHHHVGHTGDFDPILTRNGDTRLSARCADGHDVALIAVGGSMRIDRAWIEHFALPIERERGLPDRQDLLRVGLAELSLSATAWCGVLATVAPDAKAAPDPEQALERFRQHDRALVRTARSHHKQIPDVPAWIEQLILAADSFLIERPIGTRLAGQPQAKGASVIAGYPWFGDWGRDTMIALPGLTLATGRPEIAKRILETFAGFVDRGMLPNRFPGAGETPAYNTVDAALWYIDAWRAYIEASDDLDCTRTRLPDPGVDRRALPRGHPLRDRHGPGGRPDPRRRARRAAHLDGCEGRRLGGDPEDRQAGGDQRTLVSRTAGDGRLRRAARARAAALSQRSGADTGRFCPIRSSRRTRVSTMSSTARTVRRRGRTFARIRSSRSA